MRLSLGARSAAGGGEGMGREFDSLALEFRRRFLSRFGELVRRIYREAYKLKGHGGNDGLSRNVTKLLN